MPVRAPDSIQEHRLTLGKFERAQLKSATSTERQNVWLDAIPNLAIGAASIGVGMAGYGAYRWLTDSGGIIDAFSTALSGLATATGMVKYDAIELGHMIYDNNQKQQVYRDIMLRMNTANPPTLSEFKEAERQLKLLVDEDEILRIKLNDIATGKTTGYHYNWKCIGSWLVFQRPAPVCFD